MSISTDEEAARALTNNWFLAEIDFIKTQTIRTQVFAMLMSPTDIFVENINAVTGPVAGRTVQILTLKCNDGWFVAAVRLNPLEIIRRTTPQPNYTLRGITGALGVLHEHSADNVAKSLGI